jgi:hypothetical protein
MTALVKDTALFATFIAGSWKIGAVRGTRVEIGGSQVVGAQAAAIALPAGGITIDAEARGVVDKILVALRHHGLIDT